MVRNLKKASALADEWLDKNGNLISGKNWEDFYNYVIPKSTDISEENNQNTGWIAFEVLMKYNPEGENVISALTSNGDIESYTSRLDFRKKGKITKDAQKSADIFVDN